MTAKKLHKKKSFENLIPHKSVKKKDSIKSSNLKKTKATKTNFSSKIFKKESGDITINPMIRVKTGVPGFDSLIKGGMPKGSLVVISGDPGSGKTTFCLQYIYNGAKMYNEKAVYISLESPVKELITIAKTSGMEFDKLIDEKKIIMQTVELYDFERLKNTIEDLVTSIKASRLVIDPGVILKLYFDKELEARKKIVSLAKLFNSLNCTTLITNEIELGKTSSLFGLEEYVADGVVLLYHTNIEDKFIRAIAILKMRGTEICEKLRPLKLTSQGLKIESNKDLFKGFNR